MEKYSNEQTSWPVRVAMAIKRWFRYKAMRRRVRRELRAMYKSMNKYQDSDTAFEIVKSLSRQHNTEILFAPVSGEFYITNEDQYIILTAYSVSIVNGVYHYDVQMPGEVTQYLDKYLKRIVERRRLKVKKRMESKIDRSLKDILRQAQGGPKLITTKGKMTPVE